MTTGFIYIYIYLFAGSGAPGEAQGGRSVVPNATHPNSRALETGADVFEWPFCASGGVKDSIHRCPFRLIWLNK